MRGKTFSTGLSRRKILSLTATFGLTLGLTTQWATYLILWICVSCSFVRYVVSVFVRRSIWKWTCCLSCASQKTSASGWIRKPAWNFKSERRRESKRCMKNLIVHLARGGKKLGGVSTLKTQPFTTNGRLNTPSSYLALTKCETKITERDSLPRRLQRGGGMRIRSHSPHARRRKGL